MERAGALRSLRGVLPRDSECDESLGSRFEGPVRRNGKEAAVIAVDMQPVPLTVPSSSWPFATAISRFPSETWSTGPVTATTQPSSPAATFASSAAESAAPIDSTPRISAWRPASVATSAWFPRTTAISMSSRIRWAVSVRSLVAPAPTGSRTTGAPARFAALPASSIASIQGFESVPMFNTSAPATDAISSTSSIACAITGRAPSESVAFAVSFMTT